MSDTSGTCRNSRSQWTTRCFWSLPSFPKQRAPGTISLLHSPPAFLLFTTTVTSKISPHSCRSSIQFIPPKIIASKCRGSRYFLSLRAWSNHWVCRAVEVSKQQRTLLERETLTRQSCSYVVPPLLPLMSVTSSPQQSAGWQQAKVEADEAMQNSKLRKTKQFNVALNAIPRPRHVVLQPRNRLEELFYVSKLQIRSNWAEERSRKKEKKKRKKNPPSNRQINKLFIPATCSQLLRRYGPLGKLLRTQERTIGNESWSAKTKAV
jgi:hypothetical protein